MKRMGLLFLYKSLSTTGKFTVNGILILLLTSIVSPALSQINIDGTVSGQEGEPLIGVNVQVKGDSKGTATNFEGQYELTDVNENAVLVFSYIGYQKLEIPIGGRSTLDVTMLSDAQLLDEVVVVGYGSRSKALNTSSIVSIGEEDLNKKSSTKNVGEMLQGIASGVMVRNVSGSPDAEPVIRVRGMNSILGSNSALVVIDGLQNGSLRDVNPADVKSINILKGANATAIYGSSGANGVILIETKEGTQGGKPVISLNTDFITSKVNNYLPKINAADWARYVNSIELASNLYRDPTAIFTDEDIREYERTGGVNWQDVIFQTGLSQNYNVSIDGGSDKVNYRVSGSFLDKTGLVVTSDYKRYTIQAKVNMEITDWLSAGLNWNGSNGLANVVNANRQTDNAIHGALGVPPLFPIYDAEGNYFGLDDVSDLKWSRYAPSFSLGNPLASAKEVDINNNTANNNIIGYLLLQPIEGLSLRMDFGVRKNNTRVQEFYNNNTYEGNGVNGIGRVNENTSNYFQNSNILSYDKSFGLHEFSINGIFEFKSNDYYGTSIYNENFPVHSTSFNDLGSAGLQTNSSSSSESKILSYVGRISYNYNKKYLFTASYRTDGSSVFGAENKWSTFPSGSVGWRASEENFVKNWDVVDNLMLRFSYGFTGNQAIGPYQSLANVSVTGRYPYYGSGTILNYGITRAGNPFLMWETTEQKDFGIDLSLFKGSIQFTVDYYDKVTRDLLQNRELASYTGLTSITDNIGKLNNKGYELSLHHSFSVSNFNMTNGVNFSTNKTTILDLGPVDRLGYAAGGSGASVNYELIFLFEGERWGQIYAWGYEGTWNLDEEEEAKKYGQLPGDSKYTDLNGDGVIDSEDRMFIGNVIPKFEYGFNSRIGYKNFGLSFQIQGVYGNKIFNVTRSNMLYEDRWNDRWTPENQNTNNPAIGYWDAKSREEKLKEYPSKISFPSAMGQAHSRWVEDGSYARLRDVTLSYSFPLRVTDKIGFRELSVYVSGKNLITLTKYSGFNPEVSSYDNDKTLGTSFYDYPIPRDFTVGLGLKF